jgi:tetratricopeptide (TPR) repeat protein
MRFPQTALGSVSVTLALVTLSPAPAPAQHANAPQGSPPLYEGLGAVHRPVTTRSPEAQKYFDQGLVLTYGFNHEEAIRAFREAARLDSTMCMAYWGEALALGPNINLPMDASIEPAAYAAVQRARRQASGATPLERDCVEALATRYAPEGSANRAARDSAYAGAMRRLHEKYPDDADIAVLFVESLMDLRPWDYWTAEKTPQPGTEPIVPTLERVLAAHPDHVGAIHLYIHAVEASSDPLRAVKVADRMPDLVPAAGHLVHMPSHLYRAAGRFSDAAKLNQRAADVDRRFVAAQKPAGMYPHMYFNHNLHFVAMASAMTGQSAQALTAADEVVKNASPEVVSRMPPIEMFAPVRLQVLARFGRWEQILWEPEPPMGQRYHKAMWHYARGLAQVAGAQYAKATAELDSVRAIRRAMPEEYFVSFNSGPQVLAVAENLLAGEMASRRKRHREAIPALREAVRFEDGLRYDEPPTWYFPARHALGKALLAAGKPEEAERVYRDDLQHNPGNGWALLGLAQSLEARKKKSEAAEVRRQFDSAWAAADVRINGSMF